MIAVVFKLGNTYGFGVPGAPDHGQLFEAVKAKCIPEIAFAKVFNVHIIDWKDSPTYGVISWLLS